MESYGAQYVCVIGSGGRLPMNGVHDRVRAFRESLDADTEIGIRAHGKSLSSRTASTRREGRDPRRRQPGRRGRSCREHTAGGAFFSVTDPHHRKYGCHLFALQDDAAADLVRPLSARRAQLGPGVPGHLLRRRLEAPLHDPADPAGHLNALHTDPTRQAKTY